MGFFRTGHGPTQRKPIPVFFGSSTCRPTVTTMEGAGVLYTRLRSFLCWYPGYELAWAPLVEKPCTFEQFLGHYGKKKLLDITPENQYKEVGE